MIETIRRALTRLGEVAAHPAAFALVVIYAGLWFAFDRKTLDWHAFATLGTLFMTLIIPNHCPSSDAVETDTEKAGKLQ
jgi:hypothetical protein